MNRMFARIMAVVLSAIVILTVVLTVISFSALRSQRINARLDYLASEAEDIAYLATQVSMDSGFFAYWNESREILDWKAKKVNDEFGAYIAVVDRWGSVLDNLQTAYSEDPDFVDSLSGEEIRSALELVLAGEEIRVQSVVGGDAAFTVGVPFLRYNAVAGAVLIQTKAQRIQSGMEDLVWMVGVAALAVLIFSGAAAWLSVRSILSPLDELTRAAGAMAAGDFSVRVDDSRGTEETRQLSAAFNRMSEKLARVEGSRREFVANVSHELRSPITSIRGFAEGMADGVIPEEEHPKYLRLVAEESKRLSGLVGELLELSRLEREDVQPDYSVFDINEMLRKAIITRMNDLEEKGIETECEFRSDPCPVRADAARVEEVVVNLLDNAIKFTPAAEDGEKPGRIVLETAETAGRNGGQDIRVTVYDSGTPVPEEDRDKIFDRFFTADRAHTSGKGTGLGLSICQRVLEMHGREITLLSPEETRPYGPEGAAFRFTLEKG